MSVASATPSVFFSAGEPSGDLHAAKLLSHLDTLAGDGGTVVGRGFGGDRLREAGCRLDYELTRLAVVGFVEVVPKLREFFRVADIASSVFVEQRPQAVVLVDFPGFNWHIAKRAKTQGIPVFYYLPPQLWAWGSHRLEKMKRNVDHILCNLPFEQEWYAERGVPAEYVGHPFFDEVAERQLDAEFLAEHGQFDGCQVVVLPGSRSREVKNIWPLQLEIIRELSARNPHTRFQVACLREEHRQRCQAELRASDRRLPLQFFVNRTSELIDLADCALMKSGSVSLEMMARGTPATVIYHVGRVFWEIGRRLCDLKSMTLPNMMADRTIMPEFLAIGRDTAPCVEKTIAAMDRLISDPEERQRQQSELAELCQRVGQPGASRRAAAKIADQLGLPLAASTGERLQDAVRAA